MKKFVISSFLAAVAVFALLGSASAGTVSSAVDNAVMAVNMQVGAVSFEVAHCGTCGVEGEHAAKADMKMDHGTNCGCGCKSKCGCSKPKCGCEKKCGCSKPKCGGCKDKCGCSKPKCESKCGGCKDKCGCSKPKCESKCGGCKDKCGCSKPKCESKCGCKSKCGGCKDKCLCCPKQVENYPDANRGAEGEWARDGLSRQRS